VTDITSSLSRTRIGHLCGFISLALTAFLVDDTYFRSTPAPNISGVVFVLIYFGAMLLSAGAGALASRWWFIETGCLLLLTVLVWIAEYFFVNKL
jgi:protein-S-isoprenylcysteine O-methyltransferase Ste14